jgi:hypothetical protein
MFKDGRDGRIIWHKRRTSEIHVVFLVRKSERKINLGDLGNDGRTKFKMFHKEVILEV